VLVAVGGGAAFTSRRYALARSKAAQAPRSPPPLVVTVARASQGDIGVHLDGLGTVTPIATVTVKTRVNGQLMSVDYREGQMVRQGEVLAEIDPRPFQAVLVQAEGQYRRDLATLKGARSISSGSGTCSRGTHSRSNSSTTRWRSSSSSREPSSSTRVRSRAPR